METKRTGNKKNLCTAGSIRAGNTFAADMVRARAHIPLRHLVQILQFLSGNLFGGTESGACAPVRSSRHIACTSPTVAHDWCKPKGCRLYRKKPEAARRNNELRLLFNDRDDSSCQQNPCHPACQGKAQQRPRPACRLGGHTSTGPGESRSPATILSRAQRAG